MYTRIIIYTYVQRKNLERKKNMSQTDLEYSNHIQKQSKTLALCLSLLQK